MLTHDALFAADEHLLVIVRRGPMASARDNGVVMENGTRVLVDTEELAEADIRALSKRKHVKPLCSTQSASRCRRYPTTSCRMGRRRVIAKQQCRDNEALDSLDSGASPANWHGGDVGMALRTQALKSFGKLLVERC